MTTFFSRSTFREMCHQTSNPMKNAAKRLLKSLSPAVFKISYMLSWSTVQGKIDHRVQNWSKWQDENVLINSPPGIKYLIP